MLIITNPTNAQMNYRTAAARVSTVMKHSNHCTHPHVDAAERKLLDIR